MSSCTTTIRLDSKEKQLFSDYAKTFGMSLSEFMRSSAHERIEDELDLKAWKKAKKEFDSDPQVFTSEEIAKKYL